MPRTKQRKTKRNSNGHEKIIADFNKLVQLRIKNIETEFKGLERQLDTTIETALSRFPMEIQNLTLGELLAVDVETPKKENLPPKTPRTVKDPKKSTRVPQSTNPKRVTAASDDGYQSESTASQASKATTGSKRPSRSSSQSKAKARMRSISRDRQSKLNITTTQPSKKDLLKTPVCKPTTNSFVITPKVKLNSAVNVLRKPKDGEMVFSTQGSPLLVSTTVNDKTANINVPLRNGNIVSLLPFNETISESLNLDDETRHQLKILHSHLSKVLK